MDKHYSDIPIAGKHRGETPEQEVSTSVQAPMPSDVTVEGHPITRTGIHVRHDDEGWERVSLYDAHALPEPVSGTTELGRYTSNAEIQDALARQRSNTSFVVMENTETGEVIYQNEKEIRDDLTVGGRFNQFTFFKNQEDAAAYADRRQKEGRSR